MNSHVQDRAHHLAAQADQTPLLDWDVQADAGNIRPGSIELQQTVHRRWFEKINSRPPEKWLRRKPYWRATCVAKLEILLGRPIEGAVLEIGAGTAVCSALVSKRPGVQLVTAMDYDRFCIDEMMPVVFERFEAETAKIERVYGSYNRIPRSDFYDVIIAAGALHHSEDLTVSFRALHGALKPGGIMLISDTCEFNSATTRAIVDRYEMEDPTAVERYGRAVRMKDNGDHWYRLAEWLAAAWIAGFEALPYIFDHTFGLPADDDIFRKPRPYLGPGAVSRQPYFAKDSDYDRLLLVLQKPDAQGQTPILANVTPWTVPEFAAALAHTTTATNDAPPTALRPAQARATSIGRTLASLFGRRSRAEPLS